MEPISNLLPYNSSYRIDILKDLSICIYLDYLCFRYLSDMTKIFTFLSFLALPFFVSAQFGYGFTLNHDLYQRYVNPDDGISDASSGGAVLNLSAGPKIWLGGKSMSFSIEAAANIGLVSFTLGENKGLGTLSYPIIGSLNFNGLSALSREGKMGFRIGGGIQYSKTELYSIKDEFKEQGVNRELFRTYVVQLGYGFGISGFSVHGIARYGWDPDSKANVFNFGLQYDFNLPMLKKIRDPNSAL